MAQAWRRGLPRLHFRGGPGGANPKSHNVPVAVLGHSLHLQQSFVLSLQDACLFRTISLPPSLEDSLLKVLEAQVCTIMGFFLFSL